MIVVVLVLVGVIVLREIQHRGEIRRIDTLLGDEQGRTGDLLTRLAARSLEQYQAITAPPAPSAPSRAYIADPTGLISVDVTED